jgi:predicted RNA binding protein YcfA (HicA-like mRNA interferase family)
MKKIKFKKIVAVLKYFGWYQISQKGSHIHFKHDSIYGKVTVPFHKEVCMSTFRSILNQANIQSIGFESFLRLIL